MTFPNDLEIHHGFIPLITGMLFPRTRSTLRVSSRTLLRKLFESEGGKVQSDVYWQ